MTTTLTRTISNTDDTIDSRDVIERIAELETELSDGTIEPDDRDQLTALKALASDADGYASDWQHGEQLIRDSYFEDFAQELAEDIGAINAEAAWPNNCIDWVRAARELRMDYTSVEYDGVTYWIR